MTPHATLARFSRHDLITITHDMRVSEALAVARAHRVHHLPVIHANTLVGILCSCDLHAAQPNTLVDAIMRRPVVALDHNATLLDAVSTMNAHYIGCVVLMDGNRACAVVTRADVLFAQPDLAQEFVEGQRDCCGQARHLSASADGHSLCMHCLDPSADDRFPQLATDDARRAHIQARSPFTAGSVTAGAAVASSTPPPQASITISCASRILPIMAVG
jgi:hypothetical protein